MSRISRGTIAGLSLLAWFSALPPQVPADTFVLQNGGRITGELQNPNQTPRENYIVRTPLGDITLAEKHVLRVQAKSDEERWYEATLPKMPRTVDGNWKMAELCRERGLSEQRRVHLENIVALDPNHEGARRGLGYETIDGEWRKPELWNREQGRIRYKNAWLTRQEVRLLESQEQYVKREKEWRKKINLWRSFILKRRGKQAEGVARIRSIRDPIAAAALADRLKEEKSPELKLLYIDVLGRMKTMIGVQTFISLTLSEKDENVLDACYQHLKQYGSHEAVTIYISKVGLKSSKNSLVNRAATGLARMRDADAIPHLIDALTTKHKFIISKGGGPGRINPTFTRGPNGGGGLGGLGVGGGTKVVEKEVANERVHDALVMLAGSGDLGYDKAAWKAWLARKSAPPGLDLRRSR